MTTFGASALFSGGGAADHWQPSNEWFTGDQSCSSFFWRPAFSLPQSQPTTSQFPAPHAFSADTDTDSSSASASAIAASSARLHEQRAVTTATATAHRTRESDRESDEPQDNDWAQQTLQQSVEQTQTEPVGARQSPPASAIGSSAEDAGDSEWDEWASLGLLDALDDADENDEDDCAQDESAMFGLSLSRALGSLPPRRPAMRSLTDPVLSLASGCGCGSGLLGPHLCPHSNLDPLPLESSLPFGRLLDEVLSPSLSLSSSSSAGGTLGVSAGCSSPSSGLSSLDTSPAQFDAHSRRSRFWDWAPFDLPDALAPDPFHSAHSWASDPFHPHLHSLRSAIAPSHTDETHWAATTTTNTTTNNRHTASPHSSSVSTTSSPPPPLPPPDAPATVPKAAAAQPSLQPRPVSASSGSASTTTTTAGTAPRKRLVNVFVHTESPLARPAGLHEHTCEQAVAGKEAQRSKSAHSELKKQKPRQADEEKNEEKHAVTREAPTNEGSALTVSCLPVLCIGAVQKLEGSVSATNASVQVKGLTADVLVCEPSQYQGAELRRDVVGCPMIRISTSDEPSACVMESSTVAKSTEPSQNISTTSATAQPSTASSSSVPSASAHQLTLSDCPKLVLRQRLSTPSQSAASSSSASSTTTSSCSAVNTEELRESLASVLAGAPVLLATTTSAAAANEDEAQAHVWGAEWQRWAKARARPQTQEQEQQQEGQQQDRQAVPSPNPLRKGTAAESALYECCLQLNALHLDALAVCPSALTTVLKKHLINFDASGELWRARSLSLPVVVSVTWSEIELFGGNSIIRYSIFT